MKRRAPDKRNAKYHSLYTGLCIVGKFGTDNFLFYISNSSAIRNIQNDMLPCNFRRWNKLNFT